MAGKPATISDLFAPMQSIEACMSSKGSEINSNLVSINHAILNCASTLSDGTKLIRRTVNEFKKTVDGSLKSLNEISKKQASPTSGASRITNAIGDSINSGFSGMLNTLSDISSQISIIYGNMQARTQDSHNEFVRNSMSAISGTLNDIRSDIIKRTGQPDMSGIEKYLKQISDGVYGISSSFDMKDVSEYLNRISNNTGKKPESGKKEYSPEKVLSKIASNTGDGFSKIMDRFAKRIESSLQSQASAGSGAAVGMMGAVSGSISSGFGNMSSSIMTVSQQLEIITGHVENIADNVCESLQDKIKEKAKDKIGGIKEKLFGDKEEKPEIKAPDVSGGKGAGDLAKALADAAREIDKIGFVKAKMIKMKAKSVIGGLLDVLEEYSGDLTESNMQKKNASIKHLEGISKSIADVVKNMAKTTLTAPFAVIGTKLSGKVIRSLLTAIRPLENAKSLAESQIAAKNLELISKSILKFSAKMALTSILAPIAMIGTALSGILIMEALFMFRPLGRANTTRQMMTSAVNLRVMSESILKFSAAMALNLILAVPAMAGAAVSALVIRGSMFLFKRIGMRDMSVSIGSAARNLGVISLSMLGFTLSLLASTMIMKYMLLGKEDKIDPANLISLGSAIVTYGLMIGSVMLFGLLGSTKTASDVLKGGAAIALMSGSFILFSLSILVSYMVTKTIIGTSMSDGKFDFGDIMSVVMIAPMFMLMFAAYKVYSRIGAPENTRSVLNGGLSIVMMAAGFIAFSLSLYVVHQISKSIIGDWEGGKDVAALVMDVGVFALMFGGLYLFRKIGAPENTKKVLNGGLSILVMSAGFVIFTSALYISHMMTKDMWKNENGGMDWGEMIKTVSVFALMFGSMFVFNAIGQRFPDILKGAGGVVVMSIGIAAFGFGLKFLTDPIRENSAKDLWLGPALIGTFGIEFGVMGLAAAEIALGSASALAMSVGLAGFGFGLGFFVESIKGVKWKDVGMMAATIGIVGGEFAAMGVLSIPIGLGSGAMAVAAKSLSVFGESLGVFTDSIKGMEWSDVGKMARTIGIVGGEFAALGLPVVAPFISIGGKTMQSASNAIDVLASALKKWMNLEIDDTKLTMLCVSVDRIKMAFQGNPEGKKGIGGILKSVSGALFAPFDMASITTSANALAIAGKAIKSLSDGLKVWLDFGLISDTPIDVLCSSIAKIKMAFQGSDEAEKTGGIFTKFGKVLSVPFDTALMISNANAMLIASIGIKNLAKGIKEWEDSKVDMLYVDSIATVLAKMRIIFGDMGSSGDSGSNSLMKKIIGIDLSSFRMNEVERGISAAYKMGRAITGITRGLVEYKEGVGAKFADKKYVEEFADSVALVTSGLAKTFAELASDENTISNVREGRTIIGRLFQDITVNTFGRNVITKAEVGIKSVKNLGSAIKDIAIGLKEFKDIVPSGNSSYITNVAAGLTALLEGLTKPLIAFGTTDESFGTTETKLSSVSAQYGYALSSVREISSQTVNFNRHKVDVANAIKNIGQIGDMVKGLAEGAKIMADPKIIKHLGKPGTLLDNFTVSDDATGAVGNIQRLVCSQLAIFMDLGKQIQEIGVYDDIQEVVVNQDSMFKRTKTVKVNNGSKSYLAMAVESASGIGQVILSLAEGYKSMNDVFPTDKEMTAGTARVSRSIAAIMTAFANIGYAMSADTTETFDLIPVSVGNSELTQMFGRVSGLSPLVAAASANIFENASKNIQTIVGMVATGSSSVVKSMSDIDAFYKNATAVMHAAANLATIGMVFTKHYSGDELKFYTKGKLQPETLELNSFFESDLKTAKNNAGKMSEIADILSSAVPNLGRLTPVSGNAFVTFANKMAQGMKTLTGVKTDILHATNFVKTLQSAVKEKVFENINTNTQGIATAINSIDNDIFEPYAKMIGALGTMTEKHSEFVKMQKELYELLEKIIDKINDAGNQTTETSGNAQTTQTAQTGTAQTTQKHPQYQQQIQTQQQKPLTAKLSPSTVTFDQKSVTDLVNAITDAIERLR